MPKSTRSSVKDDRLGRYSDDGQVEGLADGPVGVADGVHVQVRKEGVRTVSPHDLADDNSHDGASDILSRYIKNLPDPGRVTRSKHAASRLNQEHSNYPVKVLASTFQEISSFDSLSTSDYSSNNSTASNTTVKRASGDSFVSAEQSKLTPTSDISCNEGLMDPAEARSHIPANNIDRGSYEPEGLARLGHLGWESDDSGEHEKDSDDTEEWSEQADVDFFQKLMQKNKGELISEGNIKLLIPRFNEHGIQTKDFELQVLDDEEIKPRKCLRTHHVSKVINVKPHGTIFACSHPAYLMFPLDYEVEEPAQVICLFAQNHEKATTTDTNSTNTNQPTTEPSYNNTDSRITWLPLPRKSYRYRDGYIILQTCSLSMFTVVYKESFPEIRKKIRRRIGGSLKTDSHPGIKVTFPRGSCNDDFEASLKILYDFCHSEGNLNSLEAQGYGLASPIVMVGPPGHKFNLKGKPVEIELPIPHYREIMDRWPKSTITIWQSSTRENEEYDWINIEVDRLSTHTYRSGLVTVSFPTYHFTFFKAVWDILSDKLNDAKMGVSYFYPWMTFPMKCQAYMEENPANKAFGLEVICFNAENNPEQIQTSNYRYCVGSSLKPKLVKTGRIQIKLRSQKFQADVDAGEEESMEKEEPDFRGRDFEKQFACIFRDGITVDRGTFGKVIVDKLGVDRIRQENLFEFNLQKSGIETELVPPDSSDRWSIVAVKELAGHLGLSEDSKWKSFAKYIGFTKQEIKAKLQNSPDPFLTMMNLYQNRGGTPEEFVQSLYTVGRDFSLGSSSASNHSGTPNSTSSGVSGSGSQRSQDSTNQVTKRFQSYFNLTPWRKEEGSDSGTADMNMMDLSPTDSKDSRKRQRVVGVGELEQDSPPKQIKRQRLSLNGEKRSIAGSRGHSNGHSGGEKEKRRRYAMPDDSYSSSDESGAEGPGRGVKSISTDRHKRNPHKLTDSDLWQVSSSMNAINWRALGRTLGLEESMLLNLEHAHKGSGMRECAYQTLLTWKETKPKACTFGGLYTALCEERMNAVAKSMASLISQAN